MSTATKTKKADPKPTKARATRVTVITSGPNLMKWRQARGISRELFASMADCSERTLATYEKAGPLPKKIERPVRETVRLLNALKELAGGDSALKDWLLKRNSAFGNKTPLSLIVAGESDRLWEMVHQLRQNAFS